MKTLIFSLVVVAVAFAGDTNFGYIGSRSTYDPQPPTDGTIYEQPYDFPNLGTGIYIHSPQFAGADNFTLASAAEVKSLSFWAVFTGPGHPFDIAVDIYEDASGSMGTHVWGETVPAAYQTETLTGDQSWGLNLYRNDLQLQSYANLVAGDYWMSLSVLGAPNPVGWLVCDPTYPPNMFQYIDGWTVIGFDGWFGLYNHDVALSRSTWGSIKSTF